MLYCFKYFDVFAMIYITYNQLFNTSLHLEELENSDQRMTKNATLLWETQQKVLSIGLKGRLVRFQIYSHSTINITI